MVEDVAVLPGMLRKDVPVRSWSPAKVLADVLNRGPGLGTLAGAWTTNRTELVRHIRHWVFVAIKARAKKIASQVPIVSYRVHKPQSKKGYLTKSMRLKALTPLAGDEDLVPAPPDHPLVQLLRRPNQMDTMWDLWYEQELFGSSTGSVYFWIPPDRTRFARPAEMYVLPSHWVWPVVGRERIIDEYEIRPVEGGYKRLVFPADEVINIGYKSAISKIDHQSPLDAGSRWVDSSESVDQSRWHTFKNGSFGSVAIKLGPEFFDPSDEDINRVQQKWLSRYQGERSAGKPIILPPGLDVVPLMLSAKEMDYCQSADQLRDAILALFDVPKFVVGIAQDIQRNTSEASQVVFCQNGINPTLEMMGQGLTKNLASRWDEDLVIWWPDCSPADKAQRNTDIKLRADTSAITINEIREEFGDAAWDDGDVTPAEYSMKKQKDNAPDPMAGDDGQDQKPGQYGQQIGTQKKPSIPESADKQYKMLADGSKEHVVDVPLEMLDVLLK